ncbi:MAG TPA: secretin and TonB N-terminal domain-containing protein [Burkholderiales bacterium]|nr:secretin and TonB N-terminal domain-containing protein [Burkholderiales bacterium]
MKLRSTTPYSLLAACVLAAACATDVLLTDTRQLMSEGRMDEALAELEKASRANPGNNAYRSEYFRQRDFATAQWLAQAEALRVAGQLDSAAERYRSVLKYDPASSRGAQGVVQIETDRRHRAVVAEADKLVKAERYRDARELLAPVLTENPTQREARQLLRVIDEKGTKPAVAILQLRSSVTKPISLELKDVPLRTVFDVLARAANLNFLFDKDVRSDQKTTIVVRDAQVEDVIRQILATNQLEQKVLNETTALIYPNTPQKLREYQDLVVKTFYIANADVKQTANLIRTILKTRDIFIDEKLNLLVMKDTPNVIRQAEKLVAASDFAEPEVMLEVEVLEVGYTRLLQLGVQFPGTAATSLVGAGGTPGTLTLTELRSRSSDLVRLTFTDPLFALALRQTDGRTNLLANPRIRVKNKEKAKVHIGDRVPVLTTTAAATGGFVSQSVTYLDVGLKLEVEPLVYLEDDVGIKVALEVSNITNTIQTPSGTGTTIVYQVGTRNAATVLRLHDGETQILAGLINDADRRSATRVPGLGDLPVLGRLFSSTSDDLVKTEIVLLITPRLMRTLPRPDARAVEFAAGTEASASGGPLGGAQAQQFAPTPPAAPSPQVTAPPSVLPGNTLVPFGGLQ